MKKLLNQFILNDFFMKIYITLILINAEIKKDYKNTNNKNLWS